METTSNTQRTDDRSKSPAPEWLGRLAHDLRGPIGSIQLAARMLENSELPAEQLTELGKTIERQTNALLRLAHELDDLLSIDHGVFCTRLERCDFVTIVKNTVAHTAQHARSIGREWRPIAIRVPEIPMPIDAEERKLLQLIAQMLMAVPPAACEEAACWIECECVENQAVVRVHDEECRIYRSDAVDYLISGNAPMDPGTLGMSAVIGRQIAAAHAAVISSNDGPHGRIRELVLRMPLACA